MAENLNPRFGDNSAPDVAGLTPAKTATWDEFYNSPEGESVRAAIAKVPEFMRADVLAQLEEQYIRKAGSADAAAIAATVPKVIEESTIAREEISPYEVGTPMDVGAPLDYTAAVEALYNPENITRDTTGRDAQKKSLDQFGNIIEGGGKDAVSEAYYQSKRADAEQSARAQREAAAQNLQEQGMYSGASGMMSELQAASDLQRDANIASLGAKAMAQERMDAANRDRGTLGGSLQAGDDSWIDQYTGYQTNYGHDVSGIKQAEGASNWERGNRIGDANTVRGWETGDKNSGLYNDALYHNKNLPWQGLDAFQSTGGDVRAANDATADALERERVRKENEPDAWDYLGGALDTGAKVATFAGVGAPVGPKYNTETGEALYDPVTGKRYK